MASHNLVVPLVLWGQHAPTHCISSLMITHDQRQIITGCNDGQLVVWELTADWQLLPRCMMFGHAAAICCLTRASNHDDKPHVISASENGEMCLWDISDGHCLNNTKLPYVHTSMVTYQLIGQKNTRLICNGYYPEIHVMDPVTLEVLFSLSSMVAPDWISALCILRPVKREDDVIVAITNSGTVKVWSLGSKDIKAAEKSKVVYENESKQIRCLNAQTLTHCAYNQRTVLIVCSKYWQIYDAGDFTLLCSESSRVGERWIGGEFTSVDRVLVWSSEGTGYLYKLPKNAVASDAQFRGVAGHASKDSAPMVYQMLCLAQQKPLICPPAMTYFFGTRGSPIKLLLRGDSDGRLSIWKVPDIAEDQMTLGRRESFERMPVTFPVTSMSLQQCWQSLDTQPPGIIDHLAQEGHDPLTVTATIYIPSQGRLVCGREDGSIVIVPATQTLIMQLLDVRDHMKTSNVHVHKILKGHRGKVTSLLYPFNDSTRYEPQHIVSGSTDFSVILWDIYVGVKLHMFAVHGGEVLRLLTPPEGCNTRILSCICSVASDHSVALVSLKERKCVTLASQHLFPVQNIKWRPKDDFMIVSCTDGTVYVWQMETGHLDRVVHGVTGEEILKACDENNNPSEQLSKATISLAQAFRRRNIATFRNLAQQRFQAFQEDEDGTSSDIAGSPTRPQAYPMLIQGLRANTRDPDSHVVLFDTEALIVQLLSDEYAKLSPKTLESLGIYTNPTDSSQTSPDVSQKIAGFIAKVKDKAENLGQELQSKAERRIIVKPNQTQQSPSRSPKPPSKQKPKKPKYIKITESNQTMEITQLLMSCLHAWGHDLDLDQLCMSKLGLLKPQVPISFGLLSRGLHMSFLLPGWQRHLHSHNTQLVHKIVHHQSLNQGAVPKTHVDYFTMGNHWRISEAITTEHLLTIISIANTVMSTNTASFLVGKSPVSLIKKKFNHKGSLITETFSSDDNDDEDRQMEQTTHQGQIKQGWSLLAALHCVLLPEKVIGGLYASPKLEMLARRWQDRCLEIREASQALLLAELQRLGPDGRRQIYEEWAPHLPHYIETGHGAIKAAAKSSDDAVDNTLEDTLDDDNLDETTTTADKQQHSSTHESRKKQATSIVMLGVVAAEFGQEIEKDTKSKSKSKKSPIRLICNALTYLLLEPPSDKLPSFTPIRRAAIDLIGRGFLIWQPYMDVSAVLLGLLELCVDGDKLIPSMTFGLPLTAKADACRTARRALCLIATSQPPAFITTMAKEVARHNALTQAAQSQNPQLHTLVLDRAKSEILRVVEHLIEKLANEVADLMVEVMDVVVHCLDLTQVKTRGLKETFPNIARFSKVSYCNNTRRICVGAKNGSLAFYELKHTKCQMIAGHKKPVSTVAFSPDGKYVASYSHEERKLSFWHTSTGNIFGIGQHHTKLVKSHTVPEVKIAPGTNILKLARIRWLDHHSVALLLSTGREFRFKV